MFTEMHTLHNTHKPAPMSIHPQILNTHTHTHTHTHTKADASSKANSIIIFHPEANGQAGILLPGWLLLL